MDNLSPGDPGLHSRVLAAIGEGDKPRDESGRFASTKTAPEPEAAPVEQQPAAPEAEAAPAETQPSGTENPAADTEEAPPAVEAPAFWSAEEKAKWSDLHPDVQRVVAERERERDVAVRKAQDEAARERAEAQRQRDQYQAQLNQLVPALAQKLQSDWAQVDWVKLGADNPAEYARLRPIYERDMQAMQAAHSEQQRIAEQQRSEMAGKLQTWLQEQEAELLRTIPSWKDEKTGTAEFAEIRSYLTRQGIPAEAVAQLSDAKQIVIARKAMLYDKAQARIGKPSAAQTTPKVQRPGTSDPERPVTQAKQEQWQRLQRSGSVNDAAHILKGLI